MLLEATLRNLKQKQSVGANTTNAVSKPSPSSPDLSSALNGVDSPYTAKGVGKRVVSPTAGLGGGGNGRMASNDAAANEHQQSASSASLSANAVGLRGSKTENADDFYNNSNSNSHLLARRNNKSSSPMMAASPSFAASGKGAPINTSASGVVLLPAEDTDQGDKRSTIPMDELNTLLMAVAEEEDKLKRTRLANAAAAAAAAAEQQQARSNRHHQQAHAGGAVGKGTAAVVKPTKHHSTVTAAGSGGIAAPAHRATKSEGRALLSSDVRGDAHNDDDNVGDATVRGFNNATNSNTAKPPLNAYQELMMTRRAEAAGAGGEGGALNATIKTTATPATTPRLVAPPKNALGGKTRLNTTTGGVGDDEEEDDDHEDDDDTVAVFKGLDKSSRQILHPSVLRRGGSAAINNAKNSSSNDDDSSSSSSADDTSSSSSGSFTDSFTSNSSNWATDASEEEFDDDVVAGEAGGGPSDGDDGSPTTAAAASPKVNVKAVKRKLKRNYTSVCARMVEFCASFSSTREQHERAVRRRQQREQREKEADERRRAKRLQRQKDGKSPDFDSADKDHYDTNNASPASRARRRRRKVDRRKKRGADKGGGGGGEEDDAALLPGASPLDEADDNVRRRVTRRHRKHPYRYLIVTEDLFHNHVDARKEKARQEWVIDYGSQLLYNTRLNCFFDPYSMQFYDVASGVWSMHKPGDDDGLMGNGGINQYGTLLKGT